MDLLRLGGSLLGGVVVFLAAFVGLTVLLDPYVWPSALVSLPIAIVLGGLTAVLTHAYLRYRAAGATGPTADGPDADRARTRVVGVLAGGVAFVVVGALAALLAGTVLAFSYLVAVLFVGLPVGLLAGVVAGLATVAVRGRRDGGSRPAA